MLTQILHYGTHSYWILLTIAFIIKPAFSLTKQRNYYRIIGTLAGGAFGVAMLLLVASKTALFFIMLLLMIGTYSFMRINYLVMVLCTTPYVLILFALLGSEYKFVAGERILDTIIGCVIAFSVSYFLFPNWEADQLKNYMQGIVRANLLYLEKIIKALSGEQVSVLEYKLARKEVYLHSANLSAAFQRMVSEPKSKQLKQSQTQQFVVLNHILFSNIATISTTLLSNKAKRYPPELVQLARKAFGRLHNTLRRFEQTEEIFLPEEQTAEPTASSPDDALIKEQLTFIYNTTKDLDRITKGLTSKTTEAPAHTPLVPAQ